MRLIHLILGDPGADKGGEGKSKRAEKYGTKKSKERKLENLCFSGTNQKPERRRPFGTGLVRHRPQGLFSPFFTFLRATFFRPFRLSLVPTTCPWVSEDGIFAKEGTEEQSWVAILAFFAGGGGEGVQENENAIFGGDVMH